MRRLCWIPLIATLLCFPVQAGFELVPGTFALSQLDAAKASAAKRKVGITFLWSDKKTTSGKVAKASLEIMASLKDVTVIVYVDATSESKDMPKIVQDVINSRQAGLYFPKTVITDGEVKKAKVVAPYGEGRRFLTRLGNARRLMENDMKLIPNKAPPIVGGDVEGMRTWTDVRGRTMQAAMVARAGLDVRLRKSDGSIVSVPLAQLSQADQQFVRLNN